MRNGHFYAVNVLDDEGENFVFFFYEEIGFQPVSTEKIGFQIWFLGFHVFFHRIGNIVSPRSIANRLKFIFNDVNSSKAAEFPLGVLTTEDRDVWAKNREHLVQRNNATALDTIDSALFVLSIDDKADYSIEDPVPIVQNMLHGDSNGIINRWFDKSLSLIVCKDGNAGINFEHSWGDGKLINC